MSSIRTTVHESLPYIDAEPSAAERAAAESLIAAELRASPPSPSSSALPSLPPPSFSPLMSAELDRIASKQPLKAIDLTRYESDPPSPSSTPPEQRAALRRAYAAATYVEGRHAHLRLLDAYGRNAWLVGNWGLEAEVRTLERELAAARRDVDLLTVARRRAQDEVAGELRGLDEAWRRGVAAVVETEIAAEGLRRQVQERQGGVEGE
ncbi:Pre-mRNA-splicing factor SPF27 [Hypoxylon sp. FL1284]|nr:Pre-mRNA-splicing factor SPF27 [Hypoxylon sp. FL1284]